ncbi:MAG: Rrf2 family transcriptional regulator [Thermaerobacter sp.]|nr:Rrf2 family transcriptional regulator [Thermaerobacter sp.]
MSSKGRYGVKAVYELALHYGRGPVTVSLIAQSQNISEQYLEQLMPALKRAGIVKGIRGAQGGYMLARDPAAVSVRDVVGAVEGPIVLTDCSNESEQTVGCNELERCIGPDVWARVQDAMVDAMAAISFEQLINQQRVQAKRRLTLVKESGG